MKQKATAKQIMCYEKEVKILKRITVSSFLLLALFMAIHCIEFFLPSWIATVNIDRKLITAAKGYDTAVHNIDSIDWKIKHESKRLDDKLKKLADYNKDLELNISAVEQYEKKLATVDLKEWGETITYFQVKEWLREAESQVIIMEKSKKGIEIEVNETQGDINDLNMQYAETQATIKTLEPIKNEYYKQLEKKKEREQFWQTVSDVGCYIYPFFIFFTGLSFIVWGQNKNRLLFMQGKMTLKEYEDTVNTLVSPSTRTNPSTGLPIAPGSMCDASGTLRGGTPSSSSSWSNDGRTFSTREWCQSSSSHTHRYWDR